MAATLGNSYFAQKTGTPVTFAYNNNGTVLLVNVHYSTTNVPNSVTFNGVALTKIADGSYSSGTCIWKLAGPTLAQGSYNIVIGFAAAPGSWRVGVISWVGAVDAINGAQTAATAQSDAIFTKTIATNSVAYMSASWHHETDPGTPGTDTVELDDSDLASSAGRAYECYEIPTASTVTINATHNAHDQSACYCEITAPGGAGPMWWF